MSRHRVPELAPSRPRHLLTGRRPDPIPREYRHTGLRHRAVVEHPEAGVVTLAFTLGLAFLVMKFAQFLT